jgi:hypothetical protein
MRDLDNLEKNEMSMFREFFMNISLMEETTWAVHG